MLVETAAEQLFFVTTYLGARGPSSEWTGTGFIYAASTDKGTCHFVVTNKHVLNEAAELTVRLIQGDNGTPALGKGTQITVTGLTPDVWAGHPNERVDVAVCPLLSVFNAMGDNGAVPFFRSVAADLMLTRQKATELDAVEDVVFVGYPNGLFDSANLLPVLRRGTTATPIGVDYQGNPAFLIDASVFPGSSGSPVFIFNRGTWCDRKGTVTIGSRLICLGILAAVHVRNLTGKVSEQPSHLAAEFQEPIDLGIVYKAWTIDECVDVALGRLGLKKVQGRA